MKFPASGQVGAVGGHRALVGERRVGVATDALEDVRRHVHEVAGARHARAQALRRPHRALGSLRRLDRVNIEMAETGMIRRFRERALEQRHDLRGPLLGLAAGRVEIPGMQVEERLGGEIGDVDIVRVRLRHGAHRVGVRQVECRLAFGRRGRRVTVAPGDRLDERAFDRRRRPGAPPRLRRRGGGRHGALRRRREVDVRPQRHGDSPVAHGASGVDLHRGPERPLGLLDVEGEHQPQPLVEIALRRGQVGGDRAMVVAEVVEDRGRPRLPGARQRAVGVTLGNGGEAGRDREKGEKSAVSAHGTPPGGES